MKNERTVYTTRGCFLFIRFSSCNRKNENGYNWSYFYFSFFVWGLEKRKRMLSYPFSIVYYEIEKRNTKGRYIHGPGHWSFFVQGKSPVTGEVPWQRPVTRRFVVFFDLRLNQQLSKQWRRRWFDTPSRSLWRHCDKFAFTKFNLDLPGTDKVAKARWTFLLDNKGPLKIVIRWWKFIEHCY